MSQAQPSSADRPCEIDGKRRAIVRSLPNVANVANDSNDSVSESQFTVLDSELTKPMGEVSGFWLTALFLMLRSACGFTWWVANYNNIAPAPIDGTWTVLSNQGSVARSASQRAYNRVAQPPTSGGVP